MTEVEKAALAVQKVLSSFRETLTEEEYLQLCFQLKRILEQTIEESCRTQK